MAPEQVSDQHETDERTDVFALGCTVYHALTGLPPYKGKSPADLLTQLTERGVPSVRKNNHAVPNEAADVISKMLAVEPSDRHQSMKELKQVVDTLPKDVEKQVASIDYSAVLGDAATATPAAGTQAQRRKSTQATTNAAVKTTSSESSGKMKTVGKMSYAELVSQMSDEAAEADEAESQHKGPKSLIELTGKTGSAYRSLEAGEGIRIPRPFKIAGLLCLLCAAAFGAYVGLKSQSEQKRINAVIQKVVEKTKTPPKIKPIDPGALKERRKLAEEKRLREVAEAYAKALKMVEKNNLDGAINELKRGVLEPQGLGWKYLGDAYNLSMRAHFYKVYTDKFDEMSVPAKLGYLSQAKLDQKKAAAYYRQPDQQTQFKQSVKPWMPEYDEQFMRQTHSISPFWDKADRRRRSKIFYHGKIKRAGRDMRTWAMVLTNFKLD
jgi:hypothetical protein